MRIGITIASLRAIAGCADCSPPDTPALAMTTSLDEYDKRDAERIYIIDGADAPWGDYGRLLVHGMSAHLGRKGGREGPIQLERTGPFVPPISFPGIGDVIVTDEMKQKMEEAGFRGITFRPVEKARIVEVAWHEWDLTALEPQYYPDDGEPEGYILGRPHSPDLAIAIGDIWEVVVSDSAEMVRHQVRDRLGVKFTYLEGSWNGNDLFSVPQNRYKYASGRAKAWFEGNAGQWVSFRDGTSH